MAVPCSHGDRAIKCQLPTRRHLRLFHAFVIARNILSFVLTLMLPRKRILRLTLYCADLAMTAVHYANVA